MPDKKETVGYPLQIPKDLHVQMLHIKADTDVDLKDQIISAIKYHVETYLDEKCI